MKNPEPTITGRRVIVGLSGGVDSAVTALLLKRQGADVQALHMTNWDDDDGYCTASNDLQDARNICEDLQIPLHHVNFADDYRERVFRRFLHEYECGRTPNPDVLCNREIKFGVFRDYARRLGGDVIATGHYARAVPVDEGVHLLKGRDPGKDQSYFLHAVSSRALENVVFPLGDLHKNDVRVLARESGLPVHDKKDSTGICFIGERPFREFLAQYLPANPGPMTMPDGTPLGAHQGLMYYTLGQRQGLGIGGRRDAGDDAWYVVEKHPESNTLVVAQGDHPALYSHEIEVTEPCWIGDSPMSSRPDGGWRGSAKVRYRQTDQSCRVTALSAARLLVRFENAQRAVAPGQSAVFYEGDRCLGGGIIDRIADRPAQLKDAV